MRLVRELSPNAREWRNDPEMYLTCRQVLPISLETHEAYLQRIGIDGTIEFFGIAIPHDGVDSSSGLCQEEKIIGQCGLTDIHKYYRTAEYSLLIAPDERSKGYGTMALRLLLDFAFKNMDLEVVEGEILEGNDASISMAMKLGFQSEGVLRSRYYKKGKRLNSNIVSILKEEWLTK